MTRLLNLKVWAGLSLIGLCWFGSQQPARADIMYSTFAGTRAFDSHFSQTGGSDGGLGQAFALAPTALIFGTLNAQLFSATANAEADIVSGQLHVFSNSDGPASSDARASFSDLITIAPTQGFLNGFLATFTLTVDGTLTGNAWAGGELQVGSTVDHARVGGTAMCAAAAAVCFPLQPITGGSVSQVLSATILVDPAYPFVYIQPLLFAEANYLNGNFLLTETGLANFADTAQLSIDLPPGFTFTSNSGLLLTEVPQSVPEPATWLLLITVVLGTLCIPAWRRRARQML